MKHAHIKALALILCVLLSACGGGDDETPDRCLNGIVYDQNGTPKEASRSGDVAIIQTC